VISSLSALDGHQPLQRLLNVQCQVQQEHDLRHQGARRLPVPREFGVLKDLANPLQESRTLP
jgi:hypothetical protein